ncbi:AdoMet_MTases domain containing protein [uncultured Caudovirales phage]|uniref:AdoMet_MTases domain containing protein n=1 Tax=uncultured Caudovirales phage TaxID=2100421 RepID=A0A6J5KM96_9CAUD|nr:AdoMet_MTases domain containing protein [uncultured Caudovirales phage]
MELNQDLSSFFSSNSGSGPSPKNPPSGTGDLSGFLDAPKQAQRLRPIDAQTLSFIADQEGLTPTQKNVMSALLGQESSNGSNAVTSTDGARGAGQIMPDTFKRYAKGGESIDNEQHNLAVMARIVKDLGTKFGDDPAKIATGYFSGDGNVNAAGNTPWKSDRKDGNGKSVSSYVADVIKRVGNSVVPSAEAKTPDLGKAPKWADVESKPEYQALDDATKAQTKAAYFDYWIKPNAGGQADALRQQFLAAKEPGFMDKAMGVAKDVGGAIVDAVSPTKSVMEGQKIAPAPELPTTSKVPVKPEIRQAFNAQWDAATPEQRAAMSERPDWVGMLARERAGIFERVDANGIKAAEALDTRAEGRRARLVGQGEDPRFAETAAREGARRGVAPGQEIANLGSVAQPSTFDFETKQLFDTNQPTNGLNNPLARGLVKGGAGIAKAVLGVDQFFADALGADQYAKSMKGWGDKIRGKEDALGESGNFMERNFEGAVSSIAQQLPLMISGLKLESEAVPLAGMAMQSFGQEYSDGRAKGQNVAQATTRAAIFAAFEVIGEKFGLHGNMEAMKNVARGKPTEALIGFLTNMLKKELPGEMLTTTGQFGTDKLPGGVGLNQNATFDDYMKQMADTIAQTIMQGGMMGAAGGGAAHVVQFLKDKGPSEGVANADAELVRQQTLNKWNDNGLNGRIEPTVPSMPAEASVSPDGRIEPTLNPESQAQPVTPAEPTAVDVHPTVQAADDIVRELATQAGIPHETVLPTPAKAETSGPDSFSDQDVLDFAQTRAQHLWSKREGTLDDNVDPFTGEVASVGLTPAEQNELNKIEAAGDNVDALRQVFGFGATVASDQSQLATQAQAPAAVPSQTAEQPVPGEPQLPGMEPGMIAATQENPNVQAQTEPQGNGLTPSDQSTPESTIGSDGQPGGPANIVSDQSRAQAGATEVGASTGERHSGLPAEAAVTPPKTEKEAKAKRSQTEGEVEALLNTLPSGGFGPQADESADGRKLTRKLVARLIDKGLSEGKTNEEILGAINNGTRNALSTRAITELDQLITGKRNGTQADQAQQTETQRQEAPAAEPVTGQKFGDQIGELMTFNVNGNEIMVKATVAMPEMKYRDIHHKDGGIVSFELRGPGVNTETGYKAVSGVVYEGQMSDQRLRDMAQQAANANAKKEAPPAKPKTEKEAKARKVKAEPVSEEERLVTAISEISFKKGTVKDFIDANSKADFNRAVELGYLDNSIERPDSKLFPTNKVVYELQEKYYDFPTGKKPVRKKAAPADVTSVAPESEKNSTKTVAQSTENEQNSTQETPNASPVQTQPVSERGASQAQEDDTARNRDSEPVGTGVAATGEGTDRSQSVPRSTDESGNAGTRSAEPSGSESPSTPRDSAGVRPESGTADDHVIDAEDIGKGGLTKKYRDNIAAIKILKALETEGRVATPEERKALAKYVGWGAMKGPFDPENKQWAKQHEELKALLTPEEFRAARKSTLDAHYTSPVAVGAMFDAMQRLGFNGGRVLEPSVGSGNFFGLMPREMRNASALHGVELDSLTSRLVAALYPKAKIAKATGFEDFDIPSEYFDLVIGNPPFGSQPLVDKERSPYSGFSIHNYFLAKGIDKLRPGGIMQVIVSHNFLDAQDDRARKWIGERANLIGAARLPNTAFKENAGTDVVTDILIFQKRAEGEAPNNAAPWQEVTDFETVNPKTGETVTQKVNTYFLGNPRSVLGRQTAGGSMYSANEYTVEATGNLKEQLADWVKELPKNIYDKIDRKADTAVVDMAVPDGLKVGSFYVDASGKVMQRGNDVMGDKTANEWVPKNEAAKKRMTGMIALRDSLRTQMRLERSLDANEGEIEANRAELNKLYDDFLKKFGHLNNQTNRRIFLDDTESQLLQALEFDFDKGISKATAEKEGIEERDASAVKADILKRRVAFPPQDFLTVNSAKDALLASLNYRGKVDGSYMAEVYGKSMDEIVKELGDVVYDDPQAGIVTADEYLAGDVKTKLAEAKAAAQDDAKYKRNVEALEKVIPKDKKPSEISVSIGASFVPAELYQQFVKHITGSDSTASYVKATGQWLVEFRAGSDPALNTGKFGTSELSAQELFKLAMLGRGAVVKKTYRNPDGSTTTVVMEKETEAAREKQNAIKAEWQSWLWNDAARADQLAAIYNDKMNRIVERKFDGQHLSFPGMNPAITLLEHQKNGVWRGLQSYQVLYDHVVGAGKTFEMATLAMEMRRLGISRKPLFVVPNHLTLQWRSEFTRLYPGSNILAATPEDFSADRRERMFSKIITGDWDAVVIGHSSLKKIGLPEQTEKAVLQEQIDEVAAAVEEMKRGRGDRNIIRDMEKIRSNLEAKMKDKLAAIGKRSKVVTFDELGIDAMFIDEMHEFKNLAYNTTMDRNPGMGNPNGSAKAFDLFVKTRWLFDTFGEKTPYITATGTPVSNSLVEMFNMQRYVQYPTLKKEGLHVFDAWAKQFGSVENVYEVAPSGAGYRQSTRFAKFTNLPGLMGLYNTFADTITLDDLRAQEEAQGKRFPVPKMVGNRPVLVVAKRSPAVAALMGMPKAETTESGAIKFDLDLNGEISITKDDKSEKFIAKVGDTLIGSFETEEDARLKIVERAVSPKVTVSPDSILGRFSRLRELTKASKGKINALSLTGEANKAGLDYRLIDPHAADFPGSKINLAVDNMVKVYKQWTKDKGAQLVFCDMSIPLSARASYSSKERRLYVRGDNGSIEMKRGTMHTVPGFESLPFFIVQKGTKDTKTFEVYDAASGALIGTQPTKQDAKEKTAALVADEAKRQRWIEKREATGEISQEQIDDYNNDNDVETENSEAFTREDIAGVSGAASFSVYDDIKAKLIAKGIPEREIAFIHDYSTPVAKDKLFKAVNAGDIRFLLGSTPKMGAGTNVQKRLVGLHHIDAPWRPSDLEQREGRIIRRGNELYERDPDGFEVFIGRYATEQTYDTRRWQILEHKARGIEQLRNFDGTINEIDDIEGEAANSADMKAAASGDPMILEETQLRNDVKRLERLQAAHADEVLAMTRKARDAEQFADKYGPRNLEEVDGLIAATNKNPADKDGWANVTVDGKTYKDKESAADAIAKATSVVRAGMADEAVVKYRGVEFTFGTFGTSLTADSPTGGLGVWTAAESFSGSGFITRMANYVGRLSATKADIEAQIEKSRKDVVALREQAKAPFGQAKDLESAREAYKKVQRALLAKGPDVPESQKAAVAQGIKDQRAKLEKLGLGEAVREFFANNDGNEVTYNAFDDYTAGWEINTKPTERELKNVRSFQSAVARDIGRQGKSVSDNVLHFLPARVRADGGIEEIRAAFGVRLQWFVLNPALPAAEADTWGFFNAGNFHGTTYLRADKVSRPHLAIFGHEIVHQLRKDDPDLYHEFEDAVRRYIDPKGYKHFIENNPSAKLADTQDKKHEEFLAEIGSDAFMEPKFWQSIGNQNPTLLKKVVEIASALIEKVKAALGYNKITEYALTDYNRVVQIAAGILGQYMENQKSKASGDEISFNAKDEPSVSDTVRKVQNNVLQFFGNRGEKDLRTFGKYDRYLSTQFNKALKDPHYGKVFAYVNAMQNEVSLTSIRPAELAPGILHKIDDFKSALTTLAKGRAADKNLTAATHALFAGTLAGGTVTEGKVWTTNELRDNFGLNDAGIALYRQGRAAIDASLDEIAAAEAYAMAQGFVPKGVRRQIIDDPKNAPSFIIPVIIKQVKMLDAAIKSAKDMGADEQAANLEASRNLYLDTKRRIETIFAKAKTLKQAGYAPLMRFGDYTVTVMAIDPETGKVLRDDNGETITEFFGMFETQGEANAAFTKMQADYGEENYRITKGVKAQETHRLYQGISPETLALFAEEVGADTALKKYYQVALTERSALKRRLERKNIAGYSHDLPRVLSNFITSNGRFAAQRYYLRDLNNAIKFIPKEKGDVQDEALKLRDFMMNPNDPAAPVSAGLFAWFLGGSVASAVVNLTQPVLMTGPYLSQFGVATATKAMKTALPYALGKKEITDTDLRAAMKRASQEGIVEAQEIFHLYSQGAQGVSVQLANTLAKVPGVGNKLKASTESVRARSEAFFTLWGMMFSVAESFNRKLTFIAAWEVAKANGEKNPYAFAVRAVNETQGIYNKANRPNLARNATGRVVLTFKQFSLMYVELFNRMAKRGGPEGKRAALIMLAMLMLAAGEEGLPFMQDLNDLIDTLGQLMGYDTNTVRSKRRLAYQILGKELGDLFLYGTSTHLPLDYSGRLGLGNLIPGTGLFKTSAEGNKSRELSEVFGPAAGMAMQVSEAFDAASSGNWRKAAENMAPKAVRDLMAATDMAATGEAKDTKGRKNMDVTLGDAAVKAVGFNPTRVAEASRARGPVMQDKALQKNVESDIVDMWARGLARNDTKLQADAQKKLAEWNAKNPETPVQITPDQLRKAAREYLTEQNARIIKSTPRELRSRAGLDLAK